MANNESLESLHRQQEAAFQEGNTEALDLISVVLDDVVTDGVVAGHPEASGERVLMDFNMGRGERPFEFQLGSQTVEAIKQWTSQTPGEAE